MAPGNPFDLLGDDDNDDPSLLIAAQQKKAAAKMPSAASTKEAAKFPSKPVPPAQAVRESKSGGGPGRDGGGLGRGRGGQGRGRGGEWNRDYGSENAGAFSRERRFGGGGEDGEIRKPFERERGMYGGSHQPHHAGRRGGYANGEVDDESEQPGRRVYERRSGTGRGNELKREGSGRGNWGTMSDDVIALEHSDISEDRRSFSEKPHDQGRPIPESKRDDKEVEAKEKEVEAKEKEEREEDKEMTLEEYEKVREDKRKALLMRKVVERKVDIVKEFGSMQLLSKKDNDEVFVKLGSSRDSRKTKDNVDKDDKVKKPVSINEFLKPAEGERYYGSSGRGRGRGRGGREPYISNEGGSRDTPENAIKIEDPRLFPTLGVK